MISLRWLSFAFATTLLLATSARAGLVEPPFGDVGVCGDGAVASTLVPSNTFVGSPRCIAHCRKAASECRNVVKRVGACLSRVYNTNASFALQNCAETTTNRADEIACRGPLLDLLGLIKTSLKSSVEGALLDCADWGASCEVQCSL
jgi:hypothetical protein